MTNKGHSLVELINKIDEIDASELREHISNLERTRYILHQNFNSLEKLVDTYEDTPELASSNNREVREHFMWEFTRLIHNYVASYYSLYEHTQKITNQLDNEGVNTQYQHKLKELNIIEISTFLQRFRAYTQHYQLPPVVSKTEYKQTDSDEYWGEMTMRLSLEKERLIKWDGWNQSEEYLQSLGDEINFLEVTSMYQERISEFNDWLVAEIRRQYADEFQEHDELIEELESIRSELYENT